MPGSKEIDVAAGSKDGVGRARLPSRWSEVPRFVAAPMSRLGPNVGADGGIIIWRGVAPFIVTLAMMAIALGGALTIANGRPIGGIEGTYAWLGAGRIGPVPVPVVIMVVTFVIGAFVLRLTPYGRSVYATGGNEQAG